MAQVSKEQIVTFTKEDVEKILKNAAKELLDSNDASVESVTWQIKEGDRGPKDPMDYSEYEPTQVKTVTIKVKG